MIHFQCCVKGDEKDNSSGHTQNEVPERSVEPVGDPKSNQGKANCAIQNRHLKGGVIKERKSNHGYRCQGSKEPRTATHRY